MADTIESLNKELEHYRRLFSTKESNLAIKGYLSFVKFVTQQVDYMENFELKSHIDGKKADTVLYDRSVSIGESLPDMISKLNRLKMELKIDFDPEYDKPKVGATSPQTIGRS